VLDRLVDRITAFGARRVRVAVDGHTAAGKSTMGDELAEHLAATGRVVLRASLDDFKRPWSERHRYDRTSGEGYYRNAFDLDAARRLLLDPAAPDGSGRVALCGIDPLTQVDHSDVIVDMPVHGVLVVDGVFAFRPPLDSCWDLGIWLAVAPDVARVRAVGRDAEATGDESEAERLVRERYLASERVYIAEVDPMRRAQIVIDNTNVAAPVVLRD
jgi:uridine kinase